MYNKYLTLDLYIYMTIQPSNNFLTFKWLLNLTFYRYKTILWKENTVKCGLSGGLGWSVQSLKFECFCIRFCNFQQLPYLIF